MTDGTRFGVNVPIIGPSDGDCGVTSRGRIKPCYPVSTDCWLCHDCIQQRQAETVARLAAADRQAVADGGPSA